VVHASCTLLPAFLDFLPYRFKIVFAIDSYPVSSRKLSILFWLNLDDDPFFITELDNVSRLL
jgi:hypothetical protein